MSARATIREVAKLAGVSVATVSRTLSDPEVVSPETRQAVLKAAASMNYTPNSMARNLRQQRSRSVLVLVEDIANPFYPEVFLAMEETAQARGYTVLLGNTGHSAEREAGYWELLRSRRADGIVLFTGQVPQTGGPLPPLVLMAERSDTPVPDSPPLPLVAIDNRAAAVLATEHLLALGHRRIAHIAGPDHRSISRDRQQGWQEALTAAGQSADASLVAPGHFTIPGGEAAALRLLNHSPRPTAIFAANDESAIGALRAAKRLGLRVPQDLSVVGFDDIGLSALFEPALTTIHQPRAALGQQAMSLILDLIEGTGSPADPVILPVQLVQRESSGPAPR
jgi:LacI family repressor for deo operon, udp, cdd, tsx, nupC, and nupG